MSWRSLRTTDHLTNISKYVLTQQQHQQQLAFSSTTSLSTPTRRTYPNSIMKLLKPNSITNITIFFAASLVAAWSMPHLLVDGSEFERESNSATPSDDHADSGSVTVTASGTTTTTTTSSSTTPVTTTKTTTTIKNKKCPSYGCPLLPRDIFFDKEAQAALEIIRNLQKAQTLQPTQSSQGSDGGLESISLFYNEAFINTDRSEDQATLTLIGYKGGQVHEQINQDRAFVISPYHIYNTNTDTDSDSDDSENDVGMDESHNDNKSTRLMGVFDGHAKLGEHVSEYSMRELPNLLSSKLEKILPPKSSSSYNKNYTKNKKQQQQQIQDAINDTFIEIDKTAPADISGGCTASIVLQIYNSIYVANAGDSRSFIATYNKKTKDTSIAYITREDKPDIPEERKRVESAGGIVYVPTPDRVLSGASSRVVYVDKHTGARNGLAMSRSIGDWAAGDHGVIPNPSIEVLDVKELIRNASTTGTSSSDVEVFAVSATDGLLDFIDVESIAKTIATSLYVEDSSHPLSACESLITTAASSWWQAKSGRYRDDIAIAVSKLS